ncbi:metal-dependent hydrolase [Halomicrobium urmianum]|uniref:metal-dependent hydrolase n=1 Tax=Halomicrobium urmianum TaxID=1586233 RepID=UPI001CDA51E2|nr:metal-dependent hydrolase [Halomicrobium urmianum]
MPSTVVHVAFAGMIAAALLGDAFDRRSLLVVVGAVAVADLDAFVGLVAVAGHRTVFHTFLVPGAAALALAVDLRVSDRSALRSRYGARGVRIAWVTVVAFAAAAIGLDLFSAGGANPLWPLHDQFYQVGGRIELSDQRGVVQTFVDLSPPDADGTGGGDAGGVTDGASTQARGSSREVNVSTGVDPDPDGDADGDVERLFPIVRSGWQLLLLIVGTFVTAARLRVSETVEE